MNIRSISPWIVLGVLSLVVAGCKHSASVGGSVSYDGQAVKTGTISFTPEDGRGPTAGARIVDGRYRVENVTRGKKRVSIASVNTAELPRSSEDMARRANEVRKQGGFAVNVVDAVAADAVGNNVVVEIVDGENTMDFPLKRPK